MQAFSVTESIETIIDQIVEEDITTVKVNEDEAEADKSGSGPCGLGKMCDVGLLKCGNDTLYQRKFTQHNVYLC